MEKEHIILILLCMVFSMQTALLGATLYSNHCLEQEQLQEEIVQVQEHKIIVEYHYIEPVQKYPEDVIEEPEDEIVKEAEDFSISNAILTEQLGRVQGPQEIETYYNLPMDRVVQTMRNKGYAEIDYPYYVREDGVKMLGDFVIVAADLNTYPRGTIVQTSLGQGMVCDTGEDLSGVIDIAVEW